VSGDELVHVGVVAGQVGELTPMHVVSVVISFMSKYMELVHFILPNPLWMPGNRAGNIHNFPVLPFDFFNGGIS